MAGKLLPLYVQVLFIQIGDIVNLSTRVRYKTSELTDEIQVPAEASEDHASDAGNAEIQLDPIATAEEAKPLEAQETAVPAVNESDYTDCFISAERECTTSIYGLLRVNPYLLEHASIMRFQVESADLQLTQYSKEEGEDVKEVKLEAAKQIRAKSKGRRLECGTPFVLRSVEYDLYLTVDMENAGKGELSMILSPRLTSEALFVVKGSTDMPVHMEYEVPCHLQTDNKLVLVASPSSDGTYFWPITAKNTPVRWTFHKYEDVSVSDSYVRLMTTVRLKVKDSNCYLCTKSLEIQDKEQASFSPGLTTDPDNVSCHFVLVSADYQGGYLQWDKAFYLRQAVNGTFLNYQDKRLNFCPNGDETFQLFCKTTKATSPNVRFNLPFALLTYAKENRSDQVDLQKREPMCITEPSFTSQALTLAATFDSKYITDDICGAVCVGNSAATLFEIQPIAYEDTLSYRGLYASLAAIAPLRALLMCVVDNAEMFQENGEFGGENWLAILHDIEYLNGKLLQSLIQLQTEVKSASLTELPNKQKIMMQAKISIELVGIAAALAQIMGKKWKATGLIKQEIEESQYYESEESSSEDSESEEASEHEDQPSKEFSEQWQASEDEGKEVNEEPHNEAGDLTDQLSKPTYQVFKRALDLVLDSVKAFPPGCKQLLSVEKQLFTIIGFAGESVGRILTEIFAYGFPTITNRGEYLHAICKYFSVISAENLEEQIIFARMLNKLLTGESLEAKAFAKFTFEEFISRLNPEEAMFRFLEENGKFYVHLLGCEDVEDFEEKNPTLKGLEKITVGEITYYAVVGLDLTVAECIAALLGAFSCFELKRMPEVLSEKFGVTLGLMERIVVSVDVPMPFRIAAISCFANILSSMTPLKEHSIVDLKAPMQPQEEPASLEDLATPKAGEDIREAIRLTLTLAMQTESFFAPRTVTDKADKEAEEKADFQHNLEKVRFVTGLFGLSLTLIRLRKVEEPYIEKIMTIAKTGMELISQKERGEADKTPQYWFPLAAKALLDKVSKHLEAKTAVEELYDCLLQNINTAADSVVHKRLQNYIFAIRNAYGQFQSGVNFDTNQVIKLVEEEIVDPSQHILLRPSQFDSFVKKHTLPPSSLSTPLLSDSRFNPIAYYSLDKCTLITQGTIWSTMTGLLVNSVPLGLKFDQVLVDGIRRALKMRKVVIKHVSRLLFVEDKKAKELRKKCDLKPIFELMEQLAENGTEGLSQIINILCENPFVSGSNLLANFDSRYIAQSFINLNPRNIQVICSLLDKFDNAPKEAPEDSELAKLCFFGRCAALRFLTNFISNNNACKHTLLKYLRPSHLTALIPEVADLIRELFDFDFLSTENTKIVFKALMQEFRNPGARGYFALYYLKAIMYDRSEKFKASVQNLIIEVLGINFGKLISEFKSISAIDYEESPQVAGNPESSDSDSSDREEMAEEQEKAGEEQLMPQAEETPARTWEKGDYSYIEFCFTLLGACSVDNETVRKHIRTLDLLPSMSNIFTANKQRYGLISSVLQVVSAAYKGVTLSEEEAAFLENGLSIALYITEGVLNNESDMVNLILDNLYAVIPKRGMVPLSFKFSELQPEQLETLDQLQFLLNSSEKDISSGIIVSMPAALKILEATGRDNSALKQRFLELLPRIEGLFAKAADEEKTFNLSFCQIKLKDARMEDQISALLTNSGSKALRQMGNFSSLLVSRPSFMTPLSQLFDALKAASKYTFEMEESMSARLLHMSQEKKLTRACKCLKKLMSRIPTYSFFETAAKFSNALSFGNLRSKQLKTYIGMGIITDSFAKLFDDKRITSDVAILHFIITVLKDQPSELVIAVRDELVQHLLEKDLFATIIREFSDSIKILIASQDATLAISSYMPLLSRFDYKTYGLDFLRTELMNYVETLVCCYLQLLQRLCDNCNLTMQNYMRTGIEGVNMVKMVTDYVCTITSLAEGHLAESKLQQYADEGLKTLIEFATGPCTDNQTFIGSYVPLFIAFNKVFGTPSDSYYAWNTSAEQWEDRYTPLRATAIKLLLVLLEGNPSAEVVRCMDKFLVKSLILDNVKRVYLDYVKQYRTQITTEDESVKAIMPLVKNALNEACFLVTLLSKNENKKLQEIARDGEDLEAFKDFYMLYIGYVEIDMPPVEETQDPIASIRDIYFAIPFKCKFLPYETTKSLIVDANHDSHQDLTEGLLKSARPCKEEMEYHQVIARNPKNEYMLSQWRNLKVASLAFVSASNITLLVASEPSYYHDLVWDSWVSFIAVLLFGIIQILIYIAGTTLYVLDAFPRIKAGIVNEGISMEELAVQSDRDSQEQRYKNSLKAEETETPEAASTWLRVLADIKLDIVYVLISMLAIPMPVCYPLLLFQIFAHMPDLRTVLQAITQNKVQLLYTAVFGLILLFCVTPICFIYYSDVFDIKESNMSCDGLLECYLSVINVGLRSGGGLGDALGAPSKEDMFTFWVRLVFDFLFFIAISVIMLQVIFGIILDAFGDMRDKRSDLMEDINTKCFICGTDRSDLELYGKGWKYHFQNEHSPYAYLSFLVYLLDKDMADCSGVEKFAKEKLEKIDTTFLPSTSKLLATHKQR